MRQNNIFYLISPEMATNVPSSSNMSSIMARCEDLKSEVELTMLLNEHEICLQNAAQ